MSKSKTKKENKKFVELEAKLIEQEHRLFTLVWNFFNRNRKWEKDDIRRSAAVKAIFWRILFSPAIIAIGAGGFLGFLSIFFLWKQNDLLANQNKLIANQNSHIKIQTYLTESNRRSNQMFVMGDVLSDLNDELSNKKNTKHTLSTTLSGRIIGLSRAMSPYKYMVNDSLTKKYISPERSQLLISLLASDIDSLQISYLFSVSNFSHSDIQNIQINNGVLNNVIMNNSNLRNVDFDRCLMMNANFEDSDIRDSNFTESDLDGLSFRNSDLSKAKFYDNIYSGRTNFTNTILDSVLVVTPDWIEFVRDTIKVIGSNYIEENYEIINIDAITLFDDQSNSYCYDYMIIRRTDK